MERLDLEFLNPYTVLSTTPWIRLYKRAYDNASVAKPHRDRDPRLVWRFLARYLHKIPGIAGTGRASFQCHGIEAVFRWRAANTQFHSLYFDRFRTIYEPDVSAFILTHLPDYGCFWDVGANWGHLAGVAASNREGVQVIAFEPNPEVFADLLRFCKEAALCSSILPVPYGLSDAVRRAELRLPDGFHSGLAETHESSSGSIALVNADHLPIRAPDVVKLDVEGAEYEALLGMREVFLRNRPFLVFESFESLSRRGGFKEIYELLSSWGYKCFTREDLQVMPLQGSRVRVAARLEPVDLETRGKLPDKVNVLCVPEERP